jgi:hypothetical protein
MDKSTTSLKHGADVNCYMDWVHQWVGLGYVSGGSTGGDGGDRPQSPKKIEAEGPKREKTGKRKNERRKGKEKSRKRARKREKKRNVHLLFIFPFC